MSNVDERIESLRERNKGQYITQGVSFNKDSERQMALLKFALGNSDSFSGFIKEILARMLDDGGIHHSGGARNSASPPRDMIRPRRKAEDVGNFL